MPIQRNYGQRAAAAAGGVPLVFADENCPMMSPRIESSSANIDVTERRRDVNVRRCLFGKPNDVERRRLDVWLKDELTGHLDEKCARWNFDFKRNRPLSTATTVGQRQESSNIAVVNLDVEWTPIDSKVIPEFYKRPIHKKPTLKLDVVGTVIERQKTPEKRPLTSTSIPDGVHHHRRQRHGGIRTGFCSKNRMNETLSADAAAAAAASAAASATTVVLSSDAERIWTRSHITTCSLPSSHQHDEPSAQVVNIVAGSSSASTNLVVESATINETTPTATTTTTARTVATPSVVTRPKPKASNSLSLDRMAVTTFQQAKITSFYPHRKRCHRSMDKDFEELKTRTASVSSRFSFDKKIARISDTVATVVDCQLERCQSQPNVDPWLGEGKGKSLSLSQGDGQDQVQDQDQDQKRSPNPIVNCSNQKFWSSSCPWNVGC